MMLFYNKRIFQRCFNYKGKYWYKNIKYIPLYFKLMHHLIKNGYDEYAEWETFNWFIDTMKPILTNYNANREGVPPVIENYFELLESDEDVVEINEKAWNDIVNRMIELLDLMDESNPKYYTDDYCGAENWKKKDEEMYAAKDEFFELFSKYFYHFWD